MFYTAENIIFLLVGSLLWLEKNKEHGMAANVLTNVINKIKDSSLVAFDRINDLDYLIALYEYDKTRLIDKCQ